MDRTSELIGSQDNKIPSFEKVGQIDESFSKNPNVVWLHATIDEQHLHVNQTFLNIGGDMNTAYFSNELDVAISGSSASTFIRLSSELVKDSNNNTRPLQTLAIPFVKSEALEGTDSEESDSIVRIDPNKQILFRLTTGAISTGANMCDSYGGSGNASLEQALRNRQSLIKIQYGQFEGLRQVISLTNVHLRKTKDVKSQPLAWRVENNRDGCDGLGRIDFEKTNKVFTDYILEADNMRRNKYVYSPLPGLTKLHAAVPIMGYTSIEAMMHTPTGINADGLENLLKCTVSMVLMDDEENMQNMLTDTKTLPEIGQVSKWRSVSMKAIHYAIRIATEYRADGVVDITETQNLQFRAVESWLSDAKRNLLKECDDCDGSALLAMRLARHIGISPYGQNRYDSSTGKFVSFDSDYDEKKHEYTRAIRNSLIGTDMLLFNIIGATTGEGRKAANNSGYNNRPKNVQGHALATFIPYSSLIDALESGDEYIFQDETTRKDVKKARREAILTDGLLRAMNIAHDDLRSTDVSIDATNQNSASEHTLPIEPIEPIRDTFLRKLKSKHLAPCGIDGTITCDLNLHIESPNLNEHKALSKFQLEQFQKIGATIADRVLDISTTGPDGTHGFWTDLVETTIIGLDTPELVRLGAAAQSFVYISKHNMTPTRDDNVFSIGASVKEVHYENYALLPNAVINKDRLDVLNVLKRMTKEYAMPPRRPLSNFPSKNEVSNVESSLALVKSFIENRYKENDTLCTQEEIYANTSNSTQPRETLNMIITPRSLWGNPNGIKHLFQRLEKINADVHVSFYGLEEVEPAAVAIYLSIDPKTV